MDECQSGEKRAREEPGSKVDGGVADRAALIGTIMMTLRSSSISTEDVLALVVIASGRVVLSPVVALHSGGFSASNLYFLEDEVP